jgi:CheY-like chemotaxis protein
MTKGTILVVEDEIFVGLELKEDLERLGYSVPEVIASGEAVAEAVAKHAPDLLLMDIRLRGSMDGIEAAGRIKSRSDLPIIYLTAFSDADTIKRAGDTSPEAFLLKPFDERELAANVEIALSKARKGEPAARTLAAAVPLVDVLAGAALIADLGNRIAHANAPAARLLGFDDPTLIRGTDLSRYLEPLADSENKKAFKLRGRSGNRSPVMAWVEPITRDDGRVIGEYVAFDSMDRKERLFLEKSVGEANDALAHLLPAADAAGPGYRVGGFLLPCPSGSGDIFDVFQAGPSLVAFYGLDVMGHGILASHAAFSLRDLLPGLVRQDLDLPPQEILRGLNARYCYGGDDRRKPFFTIAFGTIDAKNGEFRVVRAGHPPVMHIKSDGTLRVMNTDGMAVGFRPDAKMEAGEGILGPGDRLLVISNGMLQSFGDLRLSDTFDAVGRFVEGSRGLPLDELVASFRRLAAENGPAVTGSDDVSLLAIERNP